MLKQFFSIFTNKSKEEVNLNQQELNKFYENNEFDAVRRLLLADKSTFLTNNQNDFIFKNFIDELSSGNTNASFSRFFYENAIKVNHKQLLQIIETPVPVEAKNYVLKTYLSKFSNISLDINYLEASHPHEKFAKFLVEAANDTSIVGDSVLYFRNYLKNGSNKKDTDEYLFYISSPLLSQHLSFDEIKNSNHASAKIIRSIFTQIRQSSFEKRKHQPENNVDRKQDEPPTLEKLNLSSLPKDIYEMVQTIIDKSKKFQSIKNFSHDPDDEYFLKSINNRYLPQTLHKYLQISPNFRDVILDSQKVSATDILKETLQVYEKRINLVQENILNETNRKLKLQGRFIQKLSQNLEHYQAGTADQIGELEIPEVEIKRVRLSRP